METVREGYEAENLRNEQMQAEAEMAGMIPPSKPGLGGKKYLIFAVALFAGIVQWQRAISRAFYGVTEYMEPLGLKVLEDSPAWMKLLQLGTLWIILALPFVVLGYFARKSRFRRPDQFIPTYLSYFLFILSIVLIVSALPAALTLAWDVSSGRSTYDQPFGIHQTDIVGWIFMFAPTIIVAFLLTRLTQQGYWSRVPAGEVESHVWESDHYSIDRRL